MKQEPDRNSIKSSSSPPSPSPFVDRLKWMFKNLKYTTILCCFKFKKQANISILEFQILKLKEKFGVDYMTLVTENAPVGDLKECLRKAIQEIDVRQERIEENLTQINRKDLQMNKKMKKRTEPVGPRQSLKVTADKSLKNHSKKSIKSIQDHYQKVSGSSSSFSVDYEYE